MRFVAISDTHGRHHELKLPQGDVLVHAGDISYTGKKEEVLEFLDWFGSRPFAYKIFIAGNHDFYLEKAGRDVVRELMPQGVIYLQDSGTIINGIRIWGSPITPFFFNWAFNRHRGPEISRHWAAIPADTDLLITHGPPYGFQDMVINEQHVGCQDLLRHVLLNKPRIHLFGHIHEAYGSITRSGIKFINASMVNESYQLTNPPVVFDLQEAVHEQLKTQ